MEVRNPAACNLNTPNTTRANSTRISSQRLKVLLAHVVRRDSPWPQPNAVWVRKSKTVSTGKCPTCALVSVRSITSVRDLDLPPDVRILRIHIYLETDAMMKRAGSVQKGPPGKEDRSLSPLKFHNGQRTFASMTNKDWALSETY